MDIHVTKLNRNVAVPAESWDVDAKTNAFVVGLGRIINDAVAGIARANFETDEAFEAACMKRIDVRVANLANGDRRAPSTKKTVVREMTQEEMIAALAKAGLIVTGQDAA